MYTNTKLLLKNILKKFRVSITFNYDKQLPKNLVKKNLALKLI